jgi:Tol biopolymer transport system component
MDGGKAVPVLVTQSNERLGVLSPDNRWVAYVSDETGNDEIYVMPFTDGSSRPQGKWKVSNGGGIRVHWRRAR